MYVAEKLKPILFPHKCCFLLEPKNVTKQLLRVGPVAVLPNHLPVHRIDGMLIVRDELELG